MEHSWVTLSLLARSVWRVLPEPRYLHPLIMTHLAKVLRRSHAPHGDGRAGRIRQCSIKITDRCNLRCHTCGQWGERGYLVSRTPAELQAGELTPERWVTLLRDLRRRGHRPNVYFWGGEPLLYDGLVELIAEAARLGMPPSIATNATRLAELAESLVAARLFLAQVSVDGPDAATHNACRPGLAPGHDNFATVLEGLSALRAARTSRRARLPLLVTLTTLSHRNEGRLLEIYEAFRGRVDALVFYLGWWIDEETSLLHAADFRARFGAEARTPASWIGSWRPSAPDRLARELRELRRRARFATPVVLVPDLDGEGRLEAYYTRHSERFGFERCVSIYSAIEVLANGDVSPCRDYADFIVGNARHQTLSALWNAEPYVTFRSSLSARGLMPACSRCCGLMGN